MEKSRYQDEVTSKLVDLVYRQLPISLIAEGFIYILCFFAFLSTSNRIVLITWFSLVVVFIFFRVGIIFFYHKYHKNSLQQLKKWFILLFICAAISGISLSPIGAIFIPVELSTKQTFIIFVILGALTAGNLFFSPIKYLYLFFLIPLYFPHIIWLFLEGNVYYNIGVSALLYMFMMLFLSKYINRFTTESIKLQFDVKAALSKLRRHEAEMAVISKRNNLLQTCPNLKEAFSIINTTAQQLFVNFNGGVVVYDESTKKMQTTEQWGTARLLKDSFNPADCWALRQGNNYIVSDPNKNIVCHHFTSIPEGGYICIPLIVRNTVIGLLNLNADAEKKITTHAQNLAITFSDVFKLALMNIRLRESLHEKAIHDPLTGLYNRRYMHEILERELAQAIREKKFLYVAMLDLDYFKQFNDKHGHEAGDAVLKYLGHLLKDTFRDTDLACRFGGEEFVLVLVNTDKKNALQRMEKLREQVKQKKLEINGVVLPTITLSIGLAEAPTDGNTMDKIIAAADQALYAAKEAGRDRVMVSGQSGKLE